VVPWAPVIPVEMVSSEAGGDSLNPGSSAELASGASWRAAAPPSWQTAARRAAAPASLRQLTEPASGAPWRAAQAHVFQLPGFLRAIGWLCSPEMKISDKPLESWQPSEFRYQWVTPCRFESGHSHESFEPVARPSRKGRKLFGFWVTHRAFPVTHGWVEPAGSVAGAAAALVSLPTTPERRIRGHLACGALGGRVRRSGGSGDRGGRAHRRPPRSAGSGATLPTTRRVRARRAVAPAM